VSNKTCLKYQYEHLASDLEDILKRCFSINPFQGYKGLFVTYSIVQNIISSEM